MVPIIKALKKYNTSVLSLMLFYENRKSIIFEVLASVAYCIMDNYLFVNSMCLHQAEIYLVHKGFENKTFNDISGIGIL